MLHTLWTLCSILLIFFIMIYPSKSGIKENKNRFFNATQSGEKIRTKTLWILIFVFFLLNVLMSILNNM
nr:preprotein translocase SecG subunit [Cryptomonas borealis]